MAISNSDIPQPLWERAVALVQKQGMPVNASTIQSAMNTLAEGGSGSAEPNIGMDNQIDNLITRTDSPGSISQTSSGNAPVTPVTSAPLQTTLPTQKPTRTLADMNLQPGAGMDEIAFGNLNAERGQGPASLNSHDAEAPDARDPDKIAYAGNTQNAAPGTQEWQPKRGAVGNFFMDLANGKSTEGPDGIKRGPVGQAFMDAGDAISNMNGPSMGDVGAVGGVSALLATLLRRGKGGAASSGVSQPGTALGNSRAGQLALPAPSSGPTIPMGGPDGWYPQANNPGMRETGIPGRKMPASAIRGGRGGGAKMRGNSSKPYDPDITLM